MKYIISILLLISTITTTYAQNVHWGGVVNVTYNDIIFDIQADNDNNLIICGQYSGTVDFDPGPGVANMTAAGNSGEDIFLAKYDSVGNYLWSHGFGTGFFYDECDRVAVDSSGNIFITGMWNGTVDFDPDAVAIYNLSSNNNTRSRFLAKYDPNGNFIAAKNVGNAVGTLPSSQDGQSGLGCDADGNVYMGGFYGTSLTLGPGVTLSIFGLSDNYIAKYNQQLDLIWAHRLGSTETEYSQGLFVHPSGQVIVLGSFRNTIDFDPGPGVFNLTQVSSTQEGYFASYDSSGQFLFAKQLSAGTSASPIAALFDSQKNIVVTGSCAGIMDADPGTGTANVGLGWNDQAFVAAYDSVGNYRWAYAYGDVNSYNAIRYVGIDTSDNIYVAGNYNPMMDINPGPDTAIFGNVYASYVSSYDTSGNFRTAFQIQEVRMRLKNNDIFLAGGFYGLDDFDPGPQTFFLQSDTANASWFLLRMHLCDAFAQSPGTINIPAICAGDTITFSVNQGGPTYEWQFSQGLTPFGPTSGSSVMVVTDSNAVSETVFVSSIGGCQNTPMVYTQVTINVATPPVISQVGDSLITPGGVVSYQWFLNDTIITGAVDSIFVPLISGIYTVMISDSNGCTAISLPFNFVISSVVDIHSDLVRVFPNPFNNEITVQLNNKWNDQKISITDITGKEIISIPQNSEQSVINTSSWLPGIYIIKVEVTDTIHRYKLVKHKH